MNDNFGMSVAISGETAIVGAIGDDVNGVLSGSAYLFDTTTGRQIAKLLPDDGAERDVFGQATATPGSNYGVWGRSNSASGFDFFAAGAGTNYGASSSRRWKSNVEPIDDPLYKLAQLRGVYFDWDADHGGHHDVGMIAEEVGAVLPEIVTYEENGIDAIGMDYSKLTPLLVEAVNALREQQVAKDIEIAEQQEEINSLRERLVELEAMVAHLASEQKGTAR